MELSVFKKNSGPRIMIRDTLYNVECPSSEEVYVRKAILKLKEICDELPKYNYKGVDKNGITLDKVEPTAAHVSANYLLAKSRNNARLSHGDAYYIGKASCIIEQVLMCKDKSKNGYYYYCEVTNDPVPKEYLEGYPGVNIVSIQVVDEKAGPYGPEFMYCYTFTREI